MLDAAREMTILEKPAFVFLALLWGVSVLILSLPIAGSFPVLQKVWYLVPAVVVSSLVALINLQDGLSLWALGITMLMMGTGYQLEVGDVTISALEVVLVFLVALFLWHQRTQGVFGDVEIRLPGQRWLIAFILFSAAAFVLSLLAGVPVERAGTQFKGFVLYPLLGYVMAAGIRSRRMLHLTVILAVGAGLIIAGLGLSEFAQHYEDPYGAYGVYRAEGGYAPMNLFGLTLVALALLTTGLSLGTDNALLRLLGLVAVAWLVTGAMTSVSRTMGIAFVGGILYLLLLRGRRARGKVYLLLIFAVCVVALILLPDAVRERLFQLSDSSTQKRRAYLRSGTRAVVNHPLGVGWGENGYPSVEFIPWYHNDYLNLAVQVGLVGLALYLGFWIHVVRAGHRWLASHAGRSDLAPFVQGSLAALVALLGSAMFAHVLWRPDIAGLVGWMLGVMVAAMRLGDGAIQPEGLDE